MDGGNWFVYASDNPVSNVDRSGKESEQIQLIAALLKLLGMIMMGGGICVEFAEFPDAVLQLLELGG